MNTRYAPLIALATAALTRLVMAEPAIPPRPLPWRGPQMPKVSGLMFNQDCTDFFYRNTIRDGVDGGALLDEYVDLLAEAGVTVLLCNTNARKTNYDSDVWETFWDGYDPDGPDDQPFLKPIPPAEIPDWRRMVHSMYALHAQGVDYPARMAERCRLRGISPWISLRMNDVHINDNLAHPFHGAMWRDQRYFRGGDMPYYARGLDYGHPEVREMYRKLIVESLQRYDIDGLELDFMREPYLFRQGAEQEGAEILREWLRGVRRLVYDAGVRRGHPIALAVRVPSRIEVAESWGLDAVRWAHEGLVDVVVATPRWATLEYDMPLDDWAEALGGTGVTLAGGLEILHRPTPGSPPVSASAEQATGAAVNVLAFGSDVVYLFNYFATAGWPKEDYVRTLRAMSRLSELVRLPRRHAITWRDITAVGEQYKPPLPASGPDVELALPTGPPPGPSANVTLEVTLMRPQDAPYVPPEATVNGTACPLKEEQWQGQSGLLVYEVPPAALPGNRRDTVRLTTPGGQPFMVGALEIRIVPAD